MDVELYVYDLSRGMARQYSMALTGVQIDAIYHTAVVLNNIEYFFGQGIHRKVPGTTHHGRPMKVVKLGQTQLPWDVVEEYIQSLESIYTPESYDLFVHNCNNFSQDLSMFLVGKDIPEEIRTLPETFLRTPIGQMLRGQIDSSMRQMTQAPDAVAGRNVAKPPSQLTNGTTKIHINGSTTTTSGTDSRAKMAEFINAQSKPFIPGQVHNITSTTELDRLLRAAQSSCAVIFFTSATCPPCKLVYPAYDELAAEAGNKATLIKVDTSVAYDAAARYSIRATPTFVTFLKGKEEERWSGADESRLRGSVRLLLQMASPQHTHTRLRLPTLYSKITKPILYTRTPPLDKLVAKIGLAAQDKAVQQLTAYIRAREAEGFENAPIPNVQAFSNWLSSNLTNIPTESRFALVDLLRIAAIDSRISSYLTTENNTSILSMLIPETMNYNSVPYNLQATTLQLLCNLFSSSVFHESLQSEASPVRSTIDRVISQCLLAEKSNARSLAAALLYNLASYDHNERLDAQPDRVLSHTSSYWTDLEPALVQAVIDEQESAETLRSLLMALGLLLYCAPSSTNAEGGLWELCLVLDVREALKAKAKISIFKSEKGLIQEIGEELLGKGGPA